MSKLNSVVPYYGTFCSLSTMDSPIQALIVELVKKSWEEGPRWVPDMNDASSVRALLDLVVTCQARDPADADRLRRVRVTLAMYIAQLGAARAELNQQI